MILRHSESHELERLACQGGMRTMYDDGMSKALAGVTTIEEVLQVTRDVQIDDVRVVRSNTIRSPLGAHAG